MRTVLTLNVLLLVTKLIRTCTSVRLHCMYVGQSTVYLISATQYIYFVQVASYLPYYGFIYPVSVIFTAYPDECRSRWWITENGCFSSQIAYFSWSSQLNSIWNVISSLQDWVVVLIVLCLPSSPSSDPYVMCFSVSIKIWNSMSTLAPCACSFTCEVLHVHVRDRSSTHQV